MIALDYTVLIQIVAFLVFWFLLTKLLFKPFIGLLAERERRTEGAKAEGRAAKEGILQEARQARERLLGQAREEAARMVQAAREEIRKELERGRELAAREAEAIARQMAEKNPGRRVGGA